MTIKERYNGIIGYFSENMPSPKSELNYRSDFELLIAVVLSAQCTDKRVNMVTPALFTAFPDAYSMSLASVEEIYSYIKSISYPNNKAKNISMLASRLQEIYSGVVPQEVEDLVTLPGVGRKTANVIVSVLFRKPAMAVDTHVFRVSDRIGLSINCKNPFQTEKQLVKHFPASLLPDAHHWLILHGRYVCVARSPKCKECGISEWCKYYSKNSKNI